MIRYLQGQEKQWGRVLWEEAFREDSASFIDYYFREVAERNRVLAWTEDGRVQSMIHLNPYDLWVRGLVWKSEYLVGVATRKELRRQGLMRGLMTRALGDLAAEGMPFCFLTPADEKLYRPFGFTYIARKPRRELAEADSLQRQRLLAGQVSSQMLGEAARWMDEWKRKHYQVYALWRPEDMPRLASEISSEDGTFDVFYEGKDIVGIESVWGLDEREQRFLYGDAPYVREFPPVDPVIMARILCLREFVRAIRLRADVKRECMAVALRVEDALLQENGGEWVWRLDHETSRLERRGNGAGVDAAMKLHLTIEELTAWLFGYGIPSGAKEAAAYVDALDGILLDEVV